MLASNHIHVPAPNAYSLLMLFAILLSAYYWARVAKSDYRLPIIYAIALGCAFLGAKVAYLLAEGWMHTGEDRWMHWLTGKSITGALLFGFISVEFCKKLLRYQKITGDRFAVIVPVGIIIGRIGCLTQGCCQGCVISEAGNRWPAVPVEIGFNLLAIVVFMILRKGKHLPFQHFHLYLLGYGVFRFLHEFLRDTPKPFMGLSGYQIACLVILLVATIAFRKRHVWLQKNTPISS